jgi:predicted peptidase
MITKLIPKSETLGHTAILPDSYDASIESFPCIIFLHGSGERAEGLTDLELKKTLINGPAKFLKTSGFVILCPQTNAWSWRTKKPDGTTVNDANEFTKWALKNYRIDPKRVYISGLSMGGEGTWFAMADAPELYAAGAPVCGRASRTEGGIVAKAGVKVWAFHGSADTSIPIESDWNAIAGYRAVNKSILVTWYENVNHNCWDRAYRADHMYHPVNMYEWFLKQSKS